MNNIFEQSYNVSKSDRESILGNKSLLIWFTGLSGSGKSTISNLVELELHKLNILTFSLDGDNIRHGINKDLTFSENDRNENIRRIAEVSKLFINAGVVILAAFVSPYLRERKNIKNVVGSQNFVEVYINTSIEECERRDVKGLYKKARLGQIKNMTGIDAPYEPPLKPDIEIKTEKTNIEQSVKQIVEFIKHKITLKNE